LLKVRAGVKDMENHPRETGLNGLGTLKKWMKQSCLKWKERKSSRKYEEKKTDKVLGWGGERGMK